MRKRIFGLVLAVVVILGMLPVYASDEIEVPEHIQNLYAPVIQAHLDFEASGFVDISEHLSGEAVVAANGIAAMYEKGIVIVRDILKSQGLDDQGFHTRLSYAFCDINGDESLEILVKASIGNIYDMHPLHPQMARDVYGIYTIFNNQVKCLVYDYIPSSPSGSLEILASHILVEETFKWGGKTLAFYNLSDNGMQLMDDLYHVNGEWTRDDKPISSKEAFEIINKYAEFSGYDEWTGVSISENSIIKVDWKPLSDFKVVPTLETKTINWHGGTVNVNWGDSLFDGNPEYATKVYNKDIALVSAALSAAAYDDNDDAYFIVRALRELGFKDNNISLYSYPNFKDDDISDGTPYKGENYHHDFVDTTMAFAIAHKPMVVNGENVNLIAIVMRGTNFNFWSRGSGDLGKDLSAIGTASQFGNEVHKGFWDFSYDVIRAMNDCFNRYPELQGKNIGLVTGHSLGGAGANLYAAQYIKNNGTSFDGGLYTYTFAAPNTYVVKNSGSGVMAGIHNFVNWEDHIVPFVPNFAGNWFGLDDGFGRWAKFGTTYGFHGGGSMELSPFSLQFNLSPFKGHDPAYYINYIENTSEPDIRGSAFEYRGIHCPVNVEVYDITTNELVGKVENNIIDEAVTQVSIFVEGDSKHLFLPGDRGYSIKLTATDDGEMTYISEAYDMNTNEIISSDTFVNISLEEGKTFINPTGQQTNRLYVTDENEMPVLEVVARNGSEIPVTSLGNIFSEWARGEVSKAFELGLIPSVLKYADLRQPITRAEFAAVSVKAYEAMSGIKANSAAVNPFVDCSDVEVLKAYNLGITTGISDTEFAPDMLLTREQAATMLTRVYKKVSLTGWTVDSDDSFTLSYIKPAPFADDSLISSWARESVYFMAANSIINGMGDNEFWPRNITDEHEAAGYGNTTREQALIIAVRMVENLNK